MAEKSLSIEQMEETLLKLHGKPDGKVAGELEGLQLTERVSPARLERWEADFPGKRTREELMKLADLTAFLNPPASDVLRDPAPDRETEERMLVMAVDYVRLTTARLPDFYATRETTHFENSISRSADYDYAPSTGREVHSQLGSSLPVASPGMTKTTELWGLHGAGEISIKVTYRDGHEVLDEETGKRANEEESALGLTSSGEFGPILSAVITDVAHTGVAWARWEQGNGEPAAVFRYAVPANQSHFRLDVSVEGKQQALFPAYHGEIKIDPATGEILRLSEVADPAGPNAPMGAAIAVDYAPVNIGNKSYVCPVKGVAFSMVRVPTPGVTDASQFPVRTNLNDIEFTNYHEFGSEVRILANASPGGENGAAPANGASDAGTSASPSTASAPAEPEAPASTGAAAESASSTAPPATEQAAATPAANSATTPEEATKPAEPAPAAESAETASAAGSNAPATNTPTEASAAAPVPTGALPGVPTLKVNSRLVIVDVVVRKDDHPVPGLKQDDFVVYEDGVPQTIHDFTPHFADEAAAPASTASAPPPPLPPDTRTNLPIANETDSITVLLLDGVNTAPADVAYVRREMIKFLKTQPPGQTMAVFALGHRLQLLQGFTTDTSELMAKLEKANATSPASLLPTEDQTFQERQELTDQVASGVSSIDVANTQNFMSNADASQTQMRMNVTIDAMQELSRYLAGMQGRKNLIWFSGSFPLQFFAVVDTVGNGGGITPTIQATGSFEKELKETADMLVAARVAVYPVDVRGALTQPMTSATQQTDYAQQVSGPPGSKPGTGAQEVFGAGTGGSYGTDRQVSEQQIASEHTTMDVIARQTGGRAVYDSNGLQHAMAEALSDGSNYYTLAYVPTNTKYNGAQRNIEVRLTQGKAQLFYRRSYYADARDTTPTAGGDKGLISAAAVLGAPPSTQILFQARVLPEGDPTLTGPMPDKDLKENPTRAFKGTPHRFVADLGVQLGELTFSDGADGARTARLEIALVAYDKDGQPVNSLGRQLNLNLSAAQFEQVSAAGKGIPVRLAIDLPPGAGVVRAVVYDMASAKIGSLEIPVVVPATEANTSSN